MFFRKNFLECWTHVPSNLKDEPAGLRHTHKKSHPLCLRWSSCVWNMVWLHVTRVIRMRLCHHWPLNGRDNFSKICMFAFSFFPKKRCRNKVMGWRLIYLKLTHSTNIYRWHAARCMCVSFFSSQKLSNRILGFETGPHSLFQLAPNSWALASHLLQPPVWPGSAGVYSYA